MKAGIWRSSLARNLLVYARSENYRCLRKAKGFRVQQFKDIKPHTEASHKCSFSVPNIKEVGSLVDGCCASCSELDRSLTTLYTIVVH